MARFNIRRTVRTWTDLVGYVRPGQSAGISEHHWIVDTRSDVMGGVVVVTFLVTPLLTAREAPLLAPTFSLPGKQLLDRRLVGGAALFGIGWGLSGYCPGPALVSLLYSYESTVVFCVAMFAGMALEGPLSRLVASS